MGQSTSLELQSGKERLADEFDFLHDQIRKHSLTLRQLTTLTYEELNAKITELNELSSKFVDCNGKQLIFELKDGADAPAVIWKGLVRIRCMKTNPETKAVEKSRDLNLKQFLQVYNTMMQMQHSMKVTHHRQQREDGDDEASCRLSKLDLDGGAAGSVDGTGDAPKFNKKPVFTMSTSLILDEIQAAASPTSPSQEECCICMEYKPEVSLPCAHSYCLPCISQWNVDHKTCPICREKLETTDDTWVLEDKPNDEDVSMEMRKSFMELTK